MTPRLARRFQFRGAHVYVEPFADIGYDVIIAALKALHCVVVESKPAQSVVLDAAFLLEGSVESLSAARPEVPIAVMAKSLAPSLEGYLRVFSPFTQKKVEAALIALLDVSLGILVS